MRKLGTLASSACLYVVAAAKFSVCLSIAWLMMVQAHCTAPYKAPELFDVPSECDLDERVDIWSLGCLL